MQADQSSDPPDDTTSSVDHSAEHERRDHLQAKRQAFEERSLQENTAEGRRIIELLWNPRDPEPTRGPKPKITLDQIVAAGVQLADAEGLRSVSMRKVAQALRVGAMSLYTYIPGKSELQELMVDRVYGELTTPDNDLTWRARVAFLAHQQWELFQRHSWLLDYNHARLPLGPHVMDHSEAMYAAIAASRLPHADIIRVVNVITWQIYGMARSVVLDAEEERTSGVSAESFWLQRGSFWFTYYDPARFPVTSEIYQSGAFEDADLLSFDSALSRLLDAVESLINRRGRGES